MEILIGWKGFSFYWANCKKGEKIADINKIRK